MKKFFLKNKSIWSLFQTIFLSFTSISFPIFFLQLNVQTILRIKIFSVNSFFIAFINMSMITGLKIYLMLANQKLNGLAVRNNQDIFCHSYQKYTFFYMKSVWGFCP